MLNERDNGQITAVNQLVAVDAADLSTVGFQLSGTWAGTFVLEGSVDNINYKSIPFRDFNAPATDPVSSTTVNGLYFANIAGLSFVQVRCSAYTSGTAKLALLSTQGSIGNGATVGGGSSESHIGMVTGNAASSSVELTRPADTSAYAALDSIADSTSSPTVVLQFTNLTRVTGGRALITKAILRTDQKTCTARFRLHLFRSAPTAINDNSPYLKLYANNSIFLGTITFAALATEDPTNSTTADTQCVPGDGSGCPLEVSSATTDIYGLLETLDAFTPANGQKIYVRLSTDQY